MTTQETQPPGSAATGRLLDSPPPVSLTTVFVTFYAGAAAAAGRTAQQVRVSAPATLPAVIALLETEHGDHLRRVLAVCTYLLDGEALDPTSAQSHLPAGAHLDVLPPFAGG